jgi:Tol biopolymer transport system component
MLTGKRAFDGESLSSLIAAILKDEPKPIQELQPLTPEPLDRLIRTSISKDPADRWQSARELRHALEWLAHAPRPVVTKASRPWMWIGVAALLAVVCLFLALPRLFQRVSPGGLTILSIVSPENAEITNFGSAISPDGKLVAFTAESSGVRRLWIRPLNSSSARVLDGTDDAVYPFWSPDSRSIGYFAVDKLKRIDLEGGAPRIICDASNGRGGTWNANGTIIFGPALSSPLAKVSAAGGVREDVSAFHAQRKDTRHNFPQFLPDGRGFLVYVRSADPALTGTYMGSLDRPLEMRPVTALLGNNFRAVFAPIPGSSRGYLVYYRDGAAFAQLFDPASVRLEGTPAPIPIREAVNSVASPGFIDISASNTGILLDGGSQRSRLQLIWRGRDGSVLGEPTPEADYFTPRLSPDGTRVAYASADPRTGEYDLWIYEFATRIPRRFTFAKGLNYYPIWSPDGRTLIYSSDSASRPNLYQRPVSGAAAPRQLIPANESQMPYDWSSDGRFISYGGVRGNDPSDVMILPVNGNASFPFLHTPGFEGHGQFYPGPGGPRWIAYTSGESGEDQVYVRRFRGGPAEETKWQVSIDGGSYPRWRGDGQELFYVAKNGKMMGVMIRFSADSVQLDPPKALFDSRLSSPVRLRYSYDVDREGKRFLLMNSAPGHRPSSLSVLLNWQDALSK